MTRFLPVLLTFSLVYATEKPHWPVSYKANLISRITGSPSGRATFYRTSDSTQKIQFLVYRAPSFFRESDSLRLTWEDNLAGFIKDYVVGDSVSTYETIELVYHDENDSLSISRSYDLKDTIQMLPKWTTPSWENRLYRLSTIIPYALRVTADSTHRYTHRYLGLVVGGQWAEVNKRFYGICLTSVVFDYVLDRDLKVFSQLIVVAGDSTEWKNGPDPQLYPMKEGFIRGIHDQNKMYLALDFEDQ